MTFAQRRNRLKTYLSERIPVVKRRISVIQHSTIFLDKPMDPVHDIPPYSIRIHFRRHWTTVSESVYIDVHV